jgi:hypothetical protein
MSVVRLPATNVVGIPPEPLVLLYAFTPTTVITLPTVGAAANTEVPEKIKVAFPALGAFGT